MGGIQNSVSLGNLKGIVVVMASGEEETVSNMIKILVSEALIARGLDIKSEYRVTNGKLVKNKKIGGKKK
jgi:hypothetical protein